MTTVPPVLAEAIEALGEEDGAKIMGAVVDGKVPAERIAFALGELGHSVSASTLRTYRRQLALAQPVKQT